MRTLTVDWAALHSAFQMNMPEVRCFLSLETGKVLKLPPGDPKLAEVRQQIDSYAAVETIASRIQYQWLDEFIKSVDEEDLRERMEAAINGKGAFRRFKDILLTLPEERRRWFEFRDHKMRERIMEWVRERGISADNDPPWLGTKAPTVSNLPNDSVDLEALRDFMIAWLDSKQVDIAAVTVEELAGSVSERFRIRQRGK
ncbi:MAG: UPF0158 family protein [Myxococcota bacterium]